MDFDAQGNLVRRRRRRRQPVRRQPQLVADRPALRAPLRRAQHGGEHERPARQDPAHQAARGRRRRARRRHDVRHPGRQHVRARHGEDASPRSTRWASATPSRVHADPSAPAWSSSASTARTPGTNSATRGPAGIIEWNHVTKPGFYGWPFCTGDNSQANTYFRFEYPSGPTGERFDCSLEQIPNESTFNTGLRHPARPGGPGHDLAQARRHHAAAVRHPDRAGLAGAELRPDLPLRPGQRVRDQVAGVLRRQLDRLQPLA